MTNLHYVGRRRDFHRRLEIEGVGSLSRGGRRSLRKTVVRKAEVLWLRENGFVKSLLDLINVKEKEGDVEEEEEGGMDEEEEEEEGGMEECWVERCHNIDILFPDSGLLGRYINIQVPSKRLWVSELGSLRSVYDGFAVFRSLKHLHIQCCPKLETLFPLNPFLYQLETLHIRFCARLESVFKSPALGVGERALPKLRSLNLWELPKLKHICRWRGSSLASLEQLRVRACPHLQHLPELDTQKVKKIEGECEWWRNVTIVTWDEGKWGEREMKKEGMNFQSRGGGPTSNTI